MLQIINNFKQFKKRKTILLNQRKTFEMIIKSNYENWARHVMKQWYIFLKQCSFVKPYFLQFSLYLFLLYLKWLTFNFNKTLHKKNNNNKIIFKIYKRQSHIKVRKIIKYYFQTKTSDAWNWFSLPTYLYFQLYYKAVSKI